MGFFSKTTDCIKLIFQASKVESFCDKAEYELESTTEVEPPSSDVLKVVNDIKRYLIVYSSKQPRLVSCRDRYASIDSKIKPHNIQIKRIFSYIEGFKEVYHLAIKYPNSFDKSKLTPYTVIANEIKRDFCFLSKEAEEFITHVGYLTDKMEEIQRQYNVQPEIVKAMSIPSGYVSKNVVENKINKLKAILPKPGTPHFYQFPSLGQFKTTIIDQNSVYIKEFAQKIIDIRASALENPIGFSNNLDIIKEYELIVNDLKGGQKDNDDVQEVFNYYGNHLFEETTSIIDCYNDLTIFWEEVLRQHKVQPLVERLFDLQNLEYIDAKAVEKMIEELNVLLPKKGMKRYYTFPTVDDLKKEIKKHNEGCIESFAEKLEFIYDDVIRNPLIFDESTIKPYQIMVSELVPKDEKSRKLLEQYNDLSLRFKEICIQYLNAPKANSLLNSQMNSYIDERMLQKTLAQLEFLRPKEGIRHFYYFPTAEDLKNSVKEHNTAFIDNHLNDEIFDDINGVSLDEDQRKAILCDEISNLVVAGAGSGKTLTICGKIKYLIDVLGVDPKNILLLSFSKDSIKDLKEKATRISDELEIKTFNGLGLKILRKPEDEKLVVNHQYDNIIRDFFDKEIEKREDLLSRVIEFYGLYSSSIDATTVYEAQCEMYEDLKKKDFKTLKTRLIELSGGKKKTLKEEKVRSYEELVIANFYYLNGIEYKYEDTYKNHTANSTHRQYMPDFHLIDYDIYHEHYALNEQGTAIHFGKSLSDDYLRGIEWKRALHRCRGTRCIETFSYQFSNGSFFDELKKVLAKNGVILKPFDSKSVWNILKNRIHGSELSSLEKLVKIFVNLYKSMYKDGTMFEELKKSEFESRYEAQRADLFLDICREAYNYYKQRLCYITTDNEEEKNNTMVDFDDMILKSVELLPMHSDEFKYQYILVDEFQDISHSRQRFLKALVEHGTSKLFAVGDDWQSIYRFSGSDIDVFTNIEKYFGKTEINFVTSTHRNSAELIRIAEPFVTANKEQFKKNVSSNIHQEDPLRLVYYNRGKIKAFLRVLKEIKATKKDAHVLVLGRYKDDVDSILTEISSAVKRTGDKLAINGFSEMKIEYKTVHSSKGLEADFVILINADDDIRRGFPSKIEDDKLLGLVLSNKSNYPFAEERRLFYVAITRTKNVCYILVNKNKPSDFVEEIKNQCAVINTSNESLVVGGGIKCPSCGGDMVLKTNRKTGQPFYGCLNWPYCECTKGID